MKTLNSIFAALLIPILFTTVGYAKVDKGYLTMDYAIKTYVEAVTMGKVKGVEEILDNNVKFTLAQGNKVINYNKMELINSLKISENINQNCRTDYSIIEKGDAQTIVKVKMDYENFSKINYVTISNTDQGWKITNVSSVYK
ncbi:MAG: nuclear transport factor 2 family protein [Arcticibacter sp.]